MVFSLNSTLSTTPILTEKIAQFLQNYVTFYKDIFCKASNLLGCYNVYTGKQLHAFQGSTVRLHNEILHSPEKPAIIHQLTRHNIPDDLIFYKHNSEKP